MADARPDAKPQEAGTAAAKPKKSKTWLVVAVLMLVEGVTVFFVAKMFSGQPTEASADHPAETAGHDEHGGGPESSAAPDAFGEVALCESKTFNRETGKLVFLHIRVSVLVKGTELDRAKKLVETKQGRIDDRITTVIRSSEPKHLNEPGLETIKRRIKYECDRIFEDETLIHEVLIPYLVQSGPGV